MKQVRLIVPAAFVGVIIASALMLPPEPRTLSTGASGTPRQIRGAFHIHTQRSDGTGTVDEVAAAAGRAGLDFIIVTDHGDGTREPDRPSYRSGVLYIDAVEISTEGGHVVALNLPQAPYPLAGEPRDVVEDVARLGGMSIAAHPGSPKPELGWTDWAAPFDGLEWLNGDSEWRDETVASLLRTLFTYPWRPAATLGALLDRPQGVVPRWDALTAERRVVALAASDAHARIGLSGAGEPYESRVSLPIPGYEQSFRTFSIFLSDVTLTGNPTDDARTVLDAIRRGNVYSAIDAVAGPAFMSFSASDGTHQAQAGDVMPDGSTLAFRAQTNAPDGARITLLKNGSVLTTAQGPNLEYSTSGTGAYRVEVHLPQQPGEPPVPWVLSNPIYVRGPAQDDRVGTPRPPAAEFAVRFENESSENFRVEHSARSQAAVDAIPTVGEGSQLMFRYALGGTRSDSPFAALVIPAGPNLSAYDRLMFVGRASRAMRVSIQLRVTDGERSERWHRSVYLDDLPREVTIFFDEMTPRGATTRQRPEIANVRDLLFVVDTVNMSPGANGMVFIDDIKFGR